MSIVVYMIVGEISKKLEIIRLQVTEYIFQTYQLDQFYFKGNQINCQLPVCLPIFHSWFKHMEVLTM